MEAKSAPGLSEEARQEIQAGHALHGLDLQALASRDDTDDVLFKTSDPARPYAVIHLTWKHRDTPPWPSSTTFSSMEQWVTECMEPDHADFEGD